MRSHPSHSLRAVLAGAALALYGATPALADDTEIYLQTGADAETGVPLVMFSLDYRSNLTNTICSNTGSPPSFSGCPQAKYFYDKGLTTQSTTADPVAGDLPAPSHPFSFFDLLRLALKIVLQNVSGVKIGLMYSNQHENGCGGPTHGSAAVGNSNRCSNGGSILMGFQLVNDSSRAYLNSKLKAMRRLKLEDNSVDHTYQGKELFFEFYRYLIGGGVYNGHNAWTSFEKSGSEFTINKNSNMEPRFGNTNVCPSSDPTKACWDPTIETGSGNNFAYISPLTGAGQCTSVNTINLFFGNSQQEADSDSAIQASTASGGTGSSRTFQGMVEFLNDIDFADHGFPDIEGGVKSYFLYKGQQSNVVNGLAQAGGTDLGLIVTDDPEAVVELLTSILNQILSVSTTFVAASVPVNVFNRAEVIDNVYIALFQAQKQPLWPGNLKKVKIQQTLDNQGATVTRLIDASSPVIDAVATDGRIKHEALTYWTTAGSLPAPAPSSLEVAGKDGRSVQRGGAGQKIPGFLGTGVGLTNAAGNRQLFTEPASYTNGTASTLLGVTADNTGFNALKSHFSPQLGTETAAQYETRITNYLKWLRGMDVLDQDPSPGGPDGNTTEPRFMKLLKQDGTSNGVIQWLLADTLHSRPVAVNYGGSASNPDIRILMGTNDGIMHMFRNTTSGGAESGAETWGFVPRELLGLSETLINSLADGAHPYGLDGAPSVYVEDNDGDGNIETGERAIAVFGLRRGGRSIYALDITDPDSPRMLWRITNTGSFSDLGYSFSTPRVGTVKYGAAPTPAVVFAGGYDLNKDARPGPGTADDEGTAIYIVNALDGSIIKKFTDPALVDSMPSDVTAIDTTGSGNFDRLYIGTTGGQIWRADIPPGASDNRGSWSLTLLADLGRHQTNDLTNDRRFFHRLDVVQAIDSIGTFDAVIGTSGDRENPRSIDAPASGDPLGTDDYLFVVKDRNITSGLVDPTGLPITFSELGDVTDNCLQAGSCVSTPDLVNGFKLELEVEGEKGLATPTTINNTIFFTTYIPNSGAASSPCLPNEGGGRLYAISLKDGSSTFNFNTADDSSPEANEEGLTKRDRYLDLRSGGIPAEVVILPPDRLLLPDLSIIKTGGTGNVPTFWYNIEDPDRPN